MMDSHELLVAADHLDRIASSLESVGTRSVMHRPTAHLLRAVALFEPVLDDSPVDNGARLVEWCELYGPAHEVARAVLNEMHL